MRPKVDALAVELCGPSGAGKSLVASALAEQLGHRGREVTLPLQRVAPTRPLGARLGAKVLIAAGEIARAPVGSARLLAACVRSNQARRDLLHRSLNWLVVRGLYRRARRQPGVHLFDQGVVQEMCSMGYRGGDWRACLASSGPGRAGLGPDVLIVVVASIDTVATRLHARPGHQSRLERLPPGERRRELERQARLVEEVEAAWFERHGRRLGTRRIEVGNEDGQLADTLGILVDLVT